MSTAEHAITSLLREGRAEAVRLPRYAPEFDFRLRWTEGYEALFAGLGDESSIDVLPERALRGGRVLLHAGGGTGKSSILHRLYREMLSATALIPILVDLRLDPVRRGAAAPTDDVDVLLSSALPNTSEDELALAAARQQVVILVDGLNEVPRNLGDAIVHELDELASRNPQIGVVVTDRLVRRDISYRWQLVTIAPLEGSKGLEGVAFWRNLALRGDREGTSRITRQTLFLKEHCSLTQLEIDQLAHAALDAYLEYQSRLFPIDDLVRAIGVDATHRLQAGGVVEQHDERASFSHHLHHDLLAARAFATVQGLWNHKGFDRLTFKASSFDALEAVAETSLATAELDLLVRAVYDWNPYGAAYVLREGGASRVSPTVLIATTAMLAERRFDLVEASVHDAEDALVLLGDLVPSVFREVRTRAELIAAVSRLFAADGKTNEWAFLFTLPEGTQMPNPQLESLEQRDSLLGWTASNVARRLMLSDEQLERLRTLAVSSEDLTVRWRAVHALGGHPGRENARVLFDIVRNTDEDFWVVRGALRALLEIAAVGEPVLRREILLDLGNILRTLADSDPDDPVVNAFARYGELHYPPPSWDVELLPLAEDLWAAADTRQQQERWETLARAIKNAQDARGVHGDER